MSKLGLSTFTPCAFVIIPLINRDLTSGDVIEILINGAWVRVRIEHDGRRFYAQAGNKRIELRSGMQARWPQRS